MIELVTPKVSIKFFSPIIQKGNFMIQPKKEIMKKLFYTIVLFLSMCTLNYASTNSTELLSMREVSQDKEYKKIAPSEVKQEVLTYIKANYGNYQISEAGVSSDGEYKLTLKKDNALLVATFTPAGDLIKIL